MSVTFLSLAAHAVPPLPGIIGDFCIEVFNDADNTIKQLDDAYRDLGNCPGDFADCQSGLFNNYAGSCVAKYIDCGYDATRDASQTCSDFSREFRDAYNDALRQARREGAGVPED